MIAWIWNILVGQLCWHKWKQIFRGEIKNRENEFVGFYYHLQCEKCGNLKEKQL